MTMLSPTLASFARVIWILSAATAAAGCGPPPAAVGAACDVGVPDSAGNVSISSPALECEGRICMQVGSGPGLCTAGCRSDDDCQTVSAAGASTCHDGFTCAAAVGVGSYACQKLCVCRDAPPNAVSCPAGS